MTKRPGQSGAHPSPNEEAKNNQNYRRDQLVQNLKSTSAACEPALDYTAEHIRALRTRLQLTRNIFAACLNISESTLQKWEYGEKRPKGAALRLISIIDRKGIDVLL
jgi:putative transcriptional regulator